MAIRITFETVDVQGAESLTPIKILTYDSKGSGITAAGKQALIDLLEKVAYIDENGQDYLDALEAALFPPANLVSITAVYTQTSSVFAGDDLDELEDDLVVTAHYDDGTTEVVTTYTLSGELSDNPSIITVSYGGKSTTFSVPVTVVSSISAVYTQSGTVYDTDTLDSLKADLVVTATYTDQSTETVASTDYTLSGTLTAGTSTITVTYGSVTDTFSVTVTSSGVTLKGYVAADGASYINIGYTPDKNTRAVIDYLSNKASGATFQTFLGVTADTTTSANGNGFYIYIGAQNPINVYVSYEGSAQAYGTIASGDRHVYDVSDSGFYMDGTYVGASHASGKGLSASVGYPFFVFARNHGNNNIRAYSTGRVYDLKIYQSDELVRHYVPAFQTSTEKYGLYDLLNHTFYGGSGSGTLSGD